MMSTLSTMSAKLSQKRCICVLDPSLALSRYGLLLVKQLAQVMDLWLGKEFWNIVDNTQFYLKHPELLLHPTSFAQIPEQYSYALQGIVQALEDWEQVQKQTSLEKLKLYRIGDNLGESFFPNYIESEIIWQYESLARSLEEHIIQCPDISEILSSAFQDTIALSATLGSSLILTHQLSTEKSNNNNLPSGICVALEHWGISCQPITPEDEIVNIERNYLRQIIIKAGIGKILWSGLQMRVLHLLVPTYNQYTIYISKDKLDKDKDNAKYPNLTKTNVWSRSESFWYSL
ncbi:hypothetical protein LC593_04680 [Nostoc sp. CHAB 5844]|nr:hypothetical protein [Nostoc sp. CHAB 5844]